MRHPRRPFLAWKLEQLVSPGHLPTQAIRLFSIIWLSGKKLPTTGAFTLSHKEFPELRRVHPSVAFGPEQRTMFGCLLKTHSEDQNRVLLCMP